MPDRLATSLRRSLVCAGAVAATTAAHAATPSRLWRGVERVVVDCRIDSTVPSSVAASICDRYLKLVQARTSYPVSAPSDLKDRDHEAELLLRVAAGMTRSADGTSALALSVEPRRIGFMNEAPAALVANVQGAVAGAGQPMLDTLIAQSLNKVLPSR